MEREKKRERPGETEEGETGETGKTGEAGRGREREGEIERGRDGERERDGYIGAQDYKEKHKLDSKQISDSAFGAHLRFCQK